MARLIVLTLFALGGSLFVWIFYGAPIHDINLWTLEKQFARASINHPIESVLLGRRNYLGPSPYGSRCVYAIGEVRHAALDKDKIRRGYQAVVRNLPLQIYFTDESELPYEIPFGEWQNGLEDILQATSTTYIVYIARKHHFLGDWRCDD
jgi:hypothetical protein